jgi:circadian clock protein KaiB
VLRPHSGGLERDQAYSDEERYRLRLYVAGVTRRSMKVIEGVQRLCETRLQGRYDLDVVDIHQQPALARADRVLATPTLVRQAPPPSLRVVGGFFAGDMFANERVLSMLDIVPPAP